MTRAQRRIGLLVIGALALLVVVVGIIAMPMLVQSALLADFPHRAAGSELIVTKEGYELAQGFAIWGPALLVSVAALAVAIFVVALRWPVKRR